MSQNQLITILVVVLLLVIAASAFVLVGPLRDMVSMAPSPGAEAPAGTSHFQLDILEQPAYKLINKQLVKEGVLPVQPSATAGKANPFL